MSARTNNAGGTVTPIALAVLRLITNSNLVGCFNRMSATHLDAPEEFDDLLGHHLYKELTKARSVGGKGAFLRRFGKFVHRRQVQHDGAVHNELDDCPTETDPQKC